MQEASLGSCRQWVPAPVHLQCLCCLQSQQGSPFSHHCPPQREEIMIINWYYKKQVWCDRKLSQCFLSGHAENKLLLPPVKPESYLTTWQSKSLAAFHLGLKIFSLQMTLPLDECPLQKVITLSLNLHFTNLKQWEKKWQRRISTYFLWLLPFPSAGTINNGVSSLDLQKESSRRLQRMSWPRGSSHQPFLYESSCATGELPGQSRWAARTPQVSCQDSPVQVSCQDSDSRQSHCIWADIYSSSALRNKHRLVTLHQQIINFVFSSVCIYWEILAQITVGTLSVCYICVYIYALAHIYLNGKEENGTVN